MARKFIGERGATATRKVPRLPSDRRTEIRYTITEALDIFIRAKEAEGVRERTVKDYRQHISYLCAYIGNDEFYIDELTSDTIRKYVLYLKDDRMAYDGVDGRKVRVTKGLATNTINMRLRTLRTMCTFWHADGMLDINPMATIKPIKDDQIEEVPGLTDDEVDSILNFFDERQFAEWRDKSLVLLLLDTGLRINEALSLSIDQLDVKQSELWIPSTVAKNRKGRIVPISREISKKLAQLHVENEQYFGSNDAIFMNAYGEPFTPDAFRRRLNRLKNKLDIPRLHPHMFRHTFCRNYILNGGDLFTLQKIVDHADITTTRKYIQMDTEHVREQHNKFSPVRRVLRKR